VRAQAASPRRQGAAGHQLPRGQRAGDEQVPARTHAHTLTSAHTHTRAGDEQQPPPPPLLVIYLSLFLVHDLELAQLSRSRLIEALPPLSLPMPLRLSPLPLLSGRMLRKIISQV
jgi:hypothetical protein